MELTNFAASVTSLKYTVLLVGLILLQLINVTTPATVAPPTIPSSQDSPKENLFAVAIVLPSQESSNDNVFAGATIPSSQESLNSNVITVATIPHSQESSNNNLLAAAPISPSQESSNDKLFAAALFPSSQESLSHNVIATTTIPLSQKSPTDNLLAAALISLSQESPNDNLLAVAPISPSQTAATILSSQKSPNHNLFAADLFSIMVASKSNQNIVYSPASIQTCLALTFIGAEGKTAEEMRNVLRLGDGDKVQVAENFKEFLQTTPHNASTSDTIDVPELKIASRLYVNEQLNVSAEFNAIAQEYFGTQAEQVNFVDNKAVAKKINSWIAEKTESKIKDIMQEAALNGDTNAVLVNAIYFKAKWLNPFSRSSTSNSKFRLNSNDSLEAEIMYNEEFFGYADLPELEATALEMPYENGDISMLIILPNEIEGLEKLEQKLKAMDLNEITAKMTIRKVFVYVPKFRIEFDVDLKEPLEKLGLTTTFSPSANFKGLFSSPQMQSLTEVKHKAFLDVNEAGSEAAAATFTTLTTLSAIFDEPTFRADHPFVFAILSKSAVYFAGHVATI